jgi:hypothetical protein
MSPLESVRAIKDLPSLFDLLHDELRWRVDPELIRDATFEWTPEELRVQESAAGQLNGGVVRQLRPLTAPQPWGIFLIEFSECRVYRTALRQVLRGLVRSRRRASQLPAWKHDNLLFICTTHDYDRFTFAHFRGETASNSTLTTFGWERGDRHLRTVCEFNLPALEWPEDEGQNAEAWLAAWSGAFDKAPLTRDFFRRFDTALAAVKKDLETHQGLDSAEAYSRAQILLERLVFLYFLQNRGWLNQQRDYLLDHFSPHRNAPNDFSYYQSFLERLFWTLAAPPGVADRLGGIPFLNGGLFDEARRRNPPPSVKNSTFALIFDELLEAFNFTVREDTPLDQEVAIDPEMLGKVFESVVLNSETDPGAFAPDKRKATGSYYTPRVVVHFICRETLRQYLSRRLTGGDWGERLEKIMALDASRELAEEDVEELRTLVTPEEGAILREELRKLRCCDPAVGSGAFLVGLLHELVNLRRVVETTANGYVDPCRQSGATWLNGVKEEIVANCLYGVDIQQQAVEICRLRLWLSLVVDLDPGLDLTAALHRILQLPNLASNFRHGDSLLDFGGVFDGQAPGFDVVVGNPPFVTARNSKKRELYRERWERVCKGEYLLLGPFFDLSFSLLRPDGQLGFIVSNAFAKREQGKPLIENLFPTITLQKVVDCSGLSFSGHGTPTCIIFGNNTKPEPGSLVRVAGILPGGGDLRTRPEESPLWQTLADHHDTPGFSDERIVVADRTQEEMTQWPWFFDPATRETWEHLEQRKAATLRDFLADNIGYGCVSRADEVYFVPLHLLRRIDPERRHIRPLTVGDEVRNWSFMSRTHALYPYEEDFRPAQIEDNPGLLTYLSAFRKHLEKRVAYGKTQLERGLQWFEYSMLFKERLKQLPLICFPDIVTHNHYCPMDAVRVFKDTAPIFTATSLEVTDLLLGYLNSSTALFWLKQVCFNKGAGEDEERDRYEFLTGKVEKLPVSGLIARGLRGEGRSLVERLARLAAECGDRGAQLPTLALRNLFEKPGEAYQAWNAALPGWAAPHPEIGAPFTTADELRDALRRCRNLRDRRREEMVARQEEMDWLVYALCDLTTAPPPELPETDLSLAPEDRPFRLLARAGGVDGAMALIPGHWSSARQSLWRDRLAILHGNVHLRRIEQPGCKRRWDEQWKTGNRWEAGQPAYDAEFLDAFSEWLSEKAEGWLETERAGGAALDEWCEALWSDQRVQAGWQVAAEATHRLAQWKHEQEGKAPPPAAGPNAGRVAFARFFKALVREQAVPEGIPFGLPWKEVEQRHSVPAAMKSLRGKLNVPRERFSQTAGRLYRIADPLQIASGAPAS